MNKSLLRAFVACSRAIPDVCVQDRNLNLYNAIGIKQVAEIVLYHDKLLPKTGF